MWKHSFFLLMAVLAISQRGVDADGLGLPNGGPGLRSNKSASIVQPDPTYFEPAMPLDFFKNIDPSKFEWMNKDEITPGGTTCGFLHARLGAIPRVNYPKVKVYVCVKFAEVQPAPRGNMAVHCGGPGSLSDCVYAMGSEMFLGPSAGTYNVISFDQRGMGRSEPTFVVDECMKETHDPELLTLQVNYLDEQSVRTASRIYKQRNLECWARKDFLLNSTARDGTTKSYHFLQYSGTRQLAEDIERVRRLVGDQKLSVYGISYGTTVMGTYATVFPNHVNLLVLDGSTCPDNDIVDWIDVLARSMNQRIDYFIASCEFGTQCGRKNMRSCVNKLNNLLQGNAKDLMDTLSLSPAKALIITTVVVFAYEDISAVLCDATEEGDYESIKKLLQALFEPQGVILKSLQDPDVDSHSKPTANELWFPQSKEDWPFSGYKMKASGSVCQDIIFGQDKTFGPYDEDLYVKTLMDLNLKYPGAGTQIPMFSPQQWYSATYYWPEPTPLSPIGNSRLTGIIAGQVYDPATPYICTQEMRENFKSATLLTSRSVNHGLNSAFDQGMRGGNGCISHYQRYFEQGYIDVPDGTVCESDAIGDVCTINEIITGQGCIGTHGFFDDDDTVPDDPPVLSE
mmetsp:Transcript_30101/g.64558  ORF Transcript_30101/g.64558 Transcript_30101/m.64558 type:complete len:625 (+) Transcript_30101:146-2020(+)